MYVSKLAVIEAWVMPILKAASVLDGPTGMALMAFVNLSSITSKLKPSFVSIGRNAVFSVGNHFRISLERRTIHQVTV